MAYDFRCDFVALEVAPTFCHYHAPDASTPFLMKAKSYAQMDLRVLSGSKNLLRIVKTRETLYRSATGYVGDRKGAD